MMTSLDAATLLKQARSAAGLSQRELARRAGTAQSVVGRIEGGQTQPGTDTLKRLLSATGLEARVELSPEPVIGSHMLEDVSRILRLSPEQRLLEVRNLSRFERGARRV